MGGTSRLIISRPLAWVNGQPWRVQPWNTEQNDEVLGPWTRVDLTGIPDDWTFGAGKVDQAKMPTELATKDRVVFMLPEYQPSNVMRIVSAPIDEDGIVGEFSEYGRFNLNVSNVSTPDALLTDRAAHIITHNNVWTLGIDQTTGNPVSVTSSSSGYLWINNFDNRYQNEGSFLVGDRLYHLTDADAYGYKTFDASGHPSSGWTQRYGAPFGGSIRFDVQAKTGNKRRIYVTGANTPDLYWAETNGSDLSAWTTAGTSGTGRWIMRGRGRSVATANRVYLLLWQDDVLSYASASIGDDGDVGAFTWGADTYFFNIGQNSTTPNVVITSSRIYLFDVGNRIAVWAPFRGGRNSYLELREDRPNTAKGQYSPQVSRARARARGATVSQAASARFAMPAFRVRVRAHVETRAVGRFAMPAFRVRVRAHVETRAVGRFAMPAFRVRARAHVETIRDCRLVSCAMTGRDLTRRFRELSQDEVAPYLWEDCFVLNMLNEAEREAADRAKLLYDDSLAVAVDVKAGKARYAIDPHIIDIERAALTADGDGWPPLRLKLFDRMELDWKTSPRSSHEAGLPWGRAFGLVFDGKHEVEIVPAPRRAGRLLLGVHRLPWATFDLDDAPEIPCVHHAALVDWALFRAFSIPDADEANEQLATFYLDRFEKYFGRRIDARKRRTQRANKPHINKLW